MKKSVKQNSTIKTKKKGVEALPPPRNASDILNKAAEALAKSRIMRKPEGENPEEEILLEKSTNKEILYPLDSLSSDVSFTELYVNKKVYTQEELEEIFKGGLEGELLLEPAHTDDDTNTDKKLGNTKSKKKKFKEKKMSIPIELMNSNNLSKSEKILQRKVIAQNKIDASKRAAAMAQNKNLNNKSSVAAKIRKKNYPEGSQRQLTMAEELGIPVDLLEAAVQSSIRFKKYIAGDISCYKRQSDTSSGTPTITFTASAGNTESNSEARKTSRPKPPKIFTAEERKKYLEQITGAPSRMTAASNSANKNFTAETISEQKIEQGDLTLSAVKTKGFDSKPTSSSSVPGPSAPASVNLAITPSPFRGHPHELVTSLMSRGDSVSDESYRVLQMMVTSSEVGTRHMAEQLEVQDIHNRLKEELAVTPSNAVVGSAVSDIVHNLMSIDPVQHAQGFDTDNETIRTDSSYAEEFEESANESVDSKKTFVLANSAGTTGTKKGLLVSSSYKSSAAPVTDISADNDSARESERSSTLRDILTAALPDDKITEDKTGLNFSSTIERIRNRSARSVGIVSETEVEDSFLSSLEEKSRVSYVDSQKLVSDKEQSSEPEDNVVELSSEKTELSSYSSGKSLSNVNKSSSEDIPPLIKLYSGEEGSSENLMVSSQIEMSAQSLNKSSSKVEILTSHIEKSLSEMEGTPVDDISSSKVSRKSSNRTKSSKTEKSSSVLDGYSLSLEKSNDIKSSRFLASNSRVKKSNVNMDNESHDKSVQFEELHSQIEKSDLPVRKSTRAEKSNISVQKSVSRAEKSNQPLQKSSKVDKKLQSLQKSSTVDKSYKPQQTSSKLNKSYQPLEKLSTVDKTYQPLEKYSAKTDKSKQHVHKSSSRIEKSTSRPQKIATKVQRKTVRYENSEHSDSTLNEKNTAELDSDSEKIDIKPPSSRIDRTELKAPKKYGKLDDLEMFEKLYKGEKLTPARRQILSILKKEFYEKELIKLRRKLKMDSDFEENKRRPKEPLTDYRTFLKYKEPNLTSTLLPDVLEWYNQARYKNTLVTNPPVTLSPPPIGATVAGASGNVKTRINEMIGAQLSVPLKSMKPSTNLGAPYFTLSGNVNEGAFDPPEKIDVPQLVKEVLHSHDRMYTITVQAAKQMSNKFNDYVKTYQHAKKRESKIFKEDRSSLDFTPSKSRQRQKS